MFTSIVAADRLFDGTGAASVLRPIVGIHEDRIGSVESGLPPAPPGNGRHFDFPGCTILPGLIDTHVHLIFSAASTNAAIIEQVGRETDEELLRRALANCQAALQAGLTTVRDCGGKGRLIQEVRDRIRHGKAVGQGHVSRSRVSQILNLLNLAPDIQEEILFLPRPARRRDQIILARLQPIAAVADWGRQRRMWRL